MMVTTADSRQQLDRLLRDLHLPTVREDYEGLARQAVQESMPYEHFLLQLAQRECEVRGQNRVDRLLRQSRMPLEKDIASFNFARIPAKVSQQIKTLVDGTFTERKENILAFGKPGSGKTHALCAIGQELIRRGRKVHFSTCSLLVQELLVAKRDLKLERMIKRLSRFDALIIDDLGYVQQSREEMEVLFTLLAERYERGSVMITSNLPFSKWEAIFKDPMTTAAAIDRLVHHSVILELNVKKSFRAEEAMRQKQEQAKA